MAEYTIPYNGPPNTINGHLWDIAIDAGGEVWICTVDGEPGTWISGSQGSGPIPSGTPGRDTAAVQAVLNAAAAAGTTAVLTEPGEFVYNAALTVKGSVAWGGPTQVHKASTTFPTTTPLVKTGTGMTGVVWSGSHSFNANHRATNCLSVPKFSHFVWNGAPSFRNGAQHDVVLGNGTTAAGSFRNVGAMHFTRTGGAHAGGYASLVVHGTDHVISNVYGFGQETGIWAQGSDNSFSDCHMSNAAILQGYRDTGQGNRFRGCIGDSYGSVVHTASGTLGSPTITDTSIRPIHGGIRVITASGTSTASSGFVPATSFVGTAGTGTSFKLVNKTGTAVNATGTITKVKLVPTHFNLQGKNGSVVSPLAEVAYTTASMAGADAVTFGPSAKTAPYVVSPLFVWAHTSGAAFANTAAGQWTTQAIFAPQQVNVTNPLSTTPGAPSRTAYNQTVSAIAPSATATTYGTTHTLGPNAGYAALGLQGYSVTTSTVSSETVTVHIQVTNTLGGTTAVTQTFTTNSTVNSVAANVAALLANNRAVANVQVKVKSSKASSTAKVTFKCYGTNVR